MNKTLSIPKDTLAVIVEEFAGNITVYAIDKSEHIDYIVQNCRKYKEFCKVVLINPDMYTGTELTK